VNNKKITIILVLVAVLVFGFSIASLFEKPTAFTTDGNFDYVSKMSSDDVSIIVKIITKYSAIDVIVEIADEPEEWQRGLMFRKALRKNYGMLFVFENEQTKRFWMKNILIPLDIIFISSALRIVDIKENVQPCKIEPCPTYTSKTPVKYVLELNGGFALENNISVGSVIEIK